ncbi:MAG: hypothetical protein JF615_04985 [Asticcacaulis sp.]|nr:hypothetical protein [Asticcacaulis sp.]
MKIPFVFSAILVLAPGVALAKVPARPRTPPAAPAAASAPVVPAVSPYEAAPWWMRDQVIAQTGYAFVDAEANRASFSGSFRGVDKTVAGAQ